MTVSFGNRIVFWGMVAAVVVAQLLAGSPLFAQAPQDSVKIEPYKGEPIYLDEPKNIAKPQFVRRETLREQYDDGKPKIEREIAHFSDNHFEADGAYREYYRNGKLFVEGQFLRGRQHGEWKYYFDNGQLNRKATYNEGKPEGPREIFRADGTLAAKRNFKEGLRDGEWISYDKTGKKPLAEEHFANGKPHGTWKTWHDSGALRQQIEFKDGERHGKAVEYDDKGEKRFEASFADGKLHGTATRWYPDGRRIVQEYEEGKLISQSS